jgi:hypothetical protein
MTGRVGRSRDYRVIGDNCHIFNDAVASTHLSDLIDIKRRRQGESNQPNRGCNQILQVGIAAVIENTVAPHRDSYNTTICYDDRKYPTPETTTQDKETKALKVVEKRHEGTHARGKWNR